MDRLAEAAVEVAAAAERAVFEAGRRADRVVGSMLRARRDLAAPDQRFVSLATLALLRWWGWIEPLRLRRPEARLLLAWLLDSTSVHPVCRAWARAIGRDPERLTALGDAPSWPAKAEGLRRLLPGQAVTTDPWRLFPSWLKEHLPLPPGEAPPKHRLVEFLRVLQARPPLWVRAQAAEESAVWAELEELGLKPWVHRRITRAARLDPETDVSHLPPLTRGDLEVHDLAAQAVGLVCDPDPGERWWVAGAGTGGKALHLAALMRGKGVVVATDRDGRKLQEAARRARRSPFHNLTTRAWDGRHVAGKPGSFEGVLVEAPSSGVGTWRRHPDARWLLDRQAIARLAELQGQWLHNAAQGVRPGGALIYSVATVTVPETQNVVRAFLEAHPGFQLDPFPDPLTGQPTPGTLWIWPQATDADAAFVARLIRSV